MTDQMVKLKMDAATDRYLALAVDDGTTEDADNRFELQANGKMLWGDGTNAQDLTLERLTGGVLGINGVAAPGSPSIVTLAASTTLTAALHASRILLLTGTGAALTQTLPAATGTGNRYLFVVGAVNTSNHIITALTGDLLYGNIITNSTGDSPDLAQPWPADQSNDIIITLNGTTTGGQAIGDWVEVIDIATDKWLVRGTTTTSGTEATPFS
jgi:hypothetical protein